MQSLLSRLSNRKLNLKADIWTVGTAEVITDAQEPLCVWIHKDRVFSPG